MNPFQKALDEVKDLTDEERTSYLIDLAGTFVQHPEPLGAEYRVQGCESEIFLRCSGNPVKIDITIEPEAISARVLGALFQQCNGFKLEDIETQFAPDLVEGLFGKLSINKTMKLFSFIVKFFRTIGELRIEQNERAEADRKT